MDPKNIVAAFLTIACLSYIYKDNPLFRLVECVAVAVCTSSMVASSYHTQLKPVLGEVFSSGKWDLLIPVSMGLLVYTRAYPKWAKLSRIPLAFWIGSYAGHYLAHYPRFLFRQVSDTFIDVTRTFPSDLIYVVIVVCVMSSSLLLVRPRTGAPALGSMQKAGRLALVFALGSSFGGLVTSRMTLLAERIRFVLVEALLVVK